MRSSPPHTYLPRGAQVSDMTPAPKVSGTRAWLRRDTGDSRSEENDGGGEACEWPEAAMPQDERHPSPHCDGEDFDNQEISPDFLVGEGSANDHRSEAEVLGGENTPAHAPLPKQVSESISLVHGRPSGPPRAFHSVVDDSCVTDLNWPESDPVDASACVAPSPMPQVSSVGPLCASVLCGEGQRSSSDSLTGPRPLVVSAGAKVKAWSDNPYAPLALLVEEGEGEPTEPRVKVIPDEAVSLELKGPPDDALSVSGEPVCHPGGRGRGTHAVTAQRAAGWGARAQ